MPGMPPPRATLQSQTKTARSALDLLSCYFAISEVASARSGNDSLTLRCHFVHRRGTRQMPTSAQMLFTMAIFGHVSFAGITLLIAVALDDSM